MQKIYNVAEKPMPGGGKLFEMIEAKKVDFADSTSKLRKDDFNNFEPVLSRIETIIDLGDLL